MKMNVSVLQSTYKHTLQIHLVVQSYKCGCLRDDTKTIFATMMIFYGKKPLFNKNWKHVSIMFSTHSYNKFTRWQSQALF